MKTPALHGARMSRRQTGERPLEATRSHPLTGRSMTVGRTALAVLAGLAAAAVIGRHAAGFSQAAAQPTPPQPTFRTEANYVRVDVYPTRAGEPVNDLTRDDFEVLEGGQPQSIDQFERVVIRAA